MLTRRHLATVAAATVAVAAVAPPLARANSDEAAITANIEAFRKAMLAQDKAVLEGLVTDKLVYGHSDGRLENTSEFIAAVMARKAKMTKLEYSDIKVNVAGNNATARHVWESQSELDGKTSNVKIQVTQVWQKQADGKWKIAARLSSRL